MIFTLTTPHSIKHNETHKISDHLYASYMVAYDTEKNQLEYKHRKCEDLGAM